MTVVKEKQAQRKAGRAARRGSRRKNASRCKCRVLCHSSGSWMPYRMRRPSCCMRRLVRSRPFCRVCRRSRRGKGAGLPGVRRKLLPHRRRARPGRLGDRAVRHPRPHPGAGRNSAAGTLDLVLVPCTAFDADCFRVGMGKGYYDRYLPRCKNAAKIGIAFEVQRVEHAAVDEHDQRLDAFVTERGIYKWK